MAVPYRARVPYRGGGNYRGTSVPAAVVAPSSMRPVALPALAAAPTAKRVTSRWQVPARHIAAAQGPWHAGGVRGSTVQLAFPGLAAMGAVQHLPWGEFSARGAVVLKRWTTLTARGGDYSAVWADYLEHAQQGAAAGWRHVTPRGASAALEWGERLAHAVQASAVWRSVVARGGYMAVPWGPSGSRRAGIGIPWPVEPDPGDGTIVVPSLPVYIMIPTLTAVLLPDRTPLELLSASLALDGDAWAWSFSAPIPHRELAKISLTASEDPPEIEVAINGYVWTFLVDGFDDNRRFGSRTATLRGRSRSAELAAPYAPQRSHVQAEDRTAAQLAGEELIDTGWTLAWDAVDWLVPGGTWSYQDLAPMDAIARIADSIGAAVESDAATRTLTVKPTYQESPWGWGAATPYAILPAAVLTQGDGSWQGGTNADGVYVYAENNATGALVKIAGTAGATQLPMIVERLAVHADAQRERGRQALAAAGRIRSVNRTLPLFPAPADPGVIPRGALVEFEEAPEAGAPAETWRGMVTGVRIEASRNGSALSVRQHLSIERQYRDAD